ncbi:hypothetical protein BCR36DRAFT_353493 [Piromyces finnis]|uniref:Uncharacterized protein n=1 Tax=Piromyces finnis TaxID=1754191 RepID=A0A1Y1V9P4_9FUNG|nr:hypothetical protein BCR36DRAFT_353493 [Piromyces finnis]|eukprot:ORX49745.1 hypothetical protein BCR36DRAFT_353493 [Piromyces finnis]
MSSENSDSLFSPKSNTFKNILSKPKEEKKSFGKEEFLARRKFFLQKLENDGGIPKPKSLINNSVSKKKTSNDKIKLSFNKPVVSSSNIKSTRSTIDEKIVIPDHNWSVSSAKSESLKKIIDLAGKKETNTVGKNVFNERQKFFADSQLSSVDQLMPRPATPPGYCYYEKCPSPSLEPRRNSYGLYTSSSPVLGSSDYKPSSPIPVISSPIISSPVIAPTQKTTTYSLPWEHGNSRKKEVVQTKPQTKPLNVIESLEKCPLVSEEVVKIQESINTTSETSQIDEKIESIKPLVPNIIEPLPEPIKYSTEVLANDEPLFISTINVEKINPSLPKHIFIEEKLPDSLVFTREQLPNDEPIELTISIVNMPEMKIPKLIHILPEPITYTKELLPYDELLEVKTETIVCDSIQTPKIITIMPEPAKVTSELLPQDQLINVETVYVDAEEKKTPEKIFIDNIEENIENGNSGDDSINNYCTNETNETQPLIDINSEVSDYSKNENEKIEEKQPLIDLLDFNNEISNNIIEDKPLIDFDNNIFENNTENNNSNLTENNLINFEDDFNIENETKKSKTNSISSISELLSNNISLSLDEPLPRKSIPTYPSEDTVNDLIEFSDDDNLSDKVKNWYNVVDNAIINEENQN